MEFRVLQAHHGDALLISWKHEGRVRNLLMDGGTTATYKTRNIKGDLHKALESIKARGEQIDLLILSHVDDDHVCGVLAGFKDDGLLAQLSKTVLFNSGASIDKAFNRPIDETHYLRGGLVGLDNDGDNLTSIRNGVTFEKTVKDLEIWDEQLVEAGRAYDFYGAKITVLSPSQEQLKKLLKEWKKKAPNSLTAGADNDYDMSFEELLCGDKFEPDGSDTNGSSIALLFELEGRHLLLLGDAHDEVIVDSIKQLRDENGLSYCSENPLVVDYVKLSHHGSHHNTSPEFLDLVESQNFIISTNGNGHGHPDKRTLARIAYRRPHSTIWFNYRSVYQSIKNSLIEEDTSRVNCRYRCSREGFEL